MDKTSKTIDSIRSKKKKTKKSTSSRFKQLKGRDNLEISESIEDVTCHGPMDEDIGDLNKILIVGNPNVGKSLVFNNLTGSYVVVSNYPGTTVTIDKGKTKINGVEIGVIDSPGMYSLSTITEEERIAKLLILKERANIILHVVDSKNLARMLPLTLQLLEAELPIILVVNMMDEAERLGIQIDIEALSKKLQIPVIPVTATTGQGIKELKEAIHKFQCGKGFKIKYDRNIETATNNLSSLLGSKYSISARALSLMLLHDDKDVRDLVISKEPKKINSKIDAIVTKTGSKYNHPLNYMIKMRLQGEVDDIVAGSVKKVSAPGNRLSERLSRVMINPITGIPIALLILYIGIYKFVGEFGAGTMVDYIESTLFGEYINPNLISWSEDNIPYSVLRDLLVGEYGIVTLGITYAIAIILPIVGTFFLVFAVIEDTGYLPRLAMLIDRLFKKIGLSGRAVIPMVLGLGCVTMATVVTRTQETKRERVIATLLLALAVPCSAQLGVIFAIMTHSPVGLMIWAVVVITVFLFIGFLSSKLLPGAPPSFYMELPPLRLPKLKNVLTKTYSRMVWYFKEIFPIFILTSIIVWFLDLIGVFQVLLGGIEPLVSALGLPNETNKIFLFGFFRRDYGAAGLYEMQDSLNWVQLTVAAVTLTLFVPCIAQFLIMIKERGLKTALFMFVFILFFAFFVGFLLNLILSNLVVG